MKTPAQLGQIKRAVRKYNEAIARAYRLETEAESYRFVKWKVTRRHYRRAQAIEKRKKLVLIRILDLPPVNVPHSEPEYS